MIINNVKPINGEKWSKYLFEMFQTYEWFVSYELDNCRDYANYVERKLCHLYQPLLNSIQNHGPHQYLLRNIKTGELSIATNLDTNKIENILLGVAKYEDNDMFLDWAEITVDDIDRYRYYLFLPHTKSLFINSFFTAQVSNDKILQEFMNTFFLGNISHLRIAFLSKYIPIDMFDVDNGVKSLGIPDSLQINILKNKLNLIFRKINVYIYSDISLVSLNGIQSKIDKLFIKNDLTDIQKAELLHIKKCLDY